jgi:hypothetical protein
LLDHEDLYRPEHLDPFRARRDREQIQPPEPTTVVVSSADDRPGSKLSGKRVSLFWGLFTFADY